MKISEQGLDLIKSFEGLQLTAYQDEVNVWTIGYGCTDRDKAFEGNVITKEQAGEYLAQSLNKFELGVQKLLEVNIKQCMFDALVCFAYNVGLGNIKNSTLLAKVNEGEFEAAADEFPKWDHAGGKVSSGILRRRNAERALFEGKDWKNA